MTKKKGCLCTALPKIPLSSLLVLNPTHTRSYGTSEIQPCSTGMKGTIHWLCAKQLGSGHVTLRLINYFQANFLASMMLAFKTSAN
jgi:hypothetical protein